MKKLLVIVLMSNLFFANSCGSNPESMAEKYMALHCDLHRLYKDSDKETSEKKLKRLETKIDKINRKMNKINKRILSEYQGNEVAMERIHQVVMSYNCDN